MKSKVLKSVLASLTLLTVVGSVGAIAARSQESQRKDIRPFMRQKLKHTQFLTQGLANQSFDMIRDNARALRKTAEDAQWRVSPNLKHLKYIAEFASIADERERPPNEKNLNGATLSWRPAQDQLRRLPQVRAGQPHHGPETGAGLNRSTIPIEKVALRRAGHALGPGLWRSSCGQSGSGSMT